MPDKPNKPTKVYSTTTYLMVRFPPEVSWKSNGTLPFTTQKFYIEAGGAEELILDGFQPSYAFLIDTFQGSALTAGTSYSFSWTISNELGESTRSSSRSFSLATCKITVAFDLFVLDETDVAHSYLNYPDNLLYWHEDRSAIFSVRSIASDGTTEHTFQLDHCVLHIQDKCDVTPYPPGTPEKSYCEPTTDTAYTPVLGEHKRQWHAMGAVSGLAHYDVCLDGLESNGDITMHIMHLKRNLESL